MKKHKERLYITGPMTGYKELNYPAFERAVKELRTAGYRVTSPHEINKKIYEKKKYGKKYERAVREDVIQMLDRTTHLATLLGWKRSRGSGRETRIAREFFMPIHTVKFWLNRGK